MPVYQPEPFSLPTTSAVPLTGAELTALINIRLSALLATHTGPSRPSYAIPGTIWRNSIDNEIYYFDGASDTPIIQSIDLLNDTHTAVEQGSIIPVGALTFAGNQYTAPVFSGPFASTVLAANRSFIASIPAGSSNTAINPTIVIGGLTLTIKDQVGNAISAGGLVSGTTYLFRVVTSTVVRIIGSSSKSSLGLSNVDNTSDLAKPLSTVNESIIENGSIIPVGMLTLSVNQYTAPALTAPFDFITPAPGQVFHIRTPVGGANTAPAPTLVLGTLTLTLLGESLEALATGDVKANSNYLIYVKTSTQAVIIGLTRKSVIDSKANLNSPTFTGTVNGISKSMVGLSNVDNTSDLAKPLSTVNESIIENGSIIPVGMLTLSVNQYTAPALTAPFDFITPAPGQVFHIRTPVGGANTAPAPTLVLGTLTLTLLGESLEALATGDVKANSNYLIYVKTSTQAVIIGLTRKSVIDSKANLNSPTFTGTVNGISKSMVGLSNVDNTSDLAKPLSTAAQTLGATGSIIPIGALTFAVNQYTAPALAAPFDYVTLAGGQIFQIVIPAGGSNTATNPTFVLGPYTLTIKDNLGGAIAAGDLVAGAYYLCRFSSSNQLRVISPITKGQIGLSNVDNTPDLAKPIQTAIQNAALGSLIVKPVSVIYNSGSNSYDLTLDSMYKTSNNSVADGTIVMFTVPETNLLTNPGIRFGVASTATTRIRNNNGAALTVGQLIPGVLYTFEKVSDFLIRASSQLFEDIPVVKALSEANAGLIANDIPRIAQQLGATLPTRPVAGTVHWQTWTDPTAFMEDQDLWFGLPLPSVPEAPALDGLLWKVIDNRTGTTADILLHGVSQTRVPRISGINARIGVAGAVQPLGAVFDGRVTITGLTLGATEQLYLQYANYVGGGLWSTPREFVASTGEFLDTLTTELGYLQTRNNWESFVYAGLLSNSQQSINITAAGATNLWAGKTAYGICACPFPANQYAQIDLTWNIATTTYLHHTGVRLRSSIPLDGSGVPAGVSLLVSQNDWQLIGGVDSGTQTVLMSGALGIFPTLVRLEVTGNVYTALVNGVQVGQYIDTLNTYPATGAPGLHLVHPGASQPLTDLLTTNFRAGNL